jgi:hypothetical protein
MQKHGMHKELRLHARPGYDGRAPADPPRRGHAAGQRWNIGLHPTSATRLFVTVRQFSIDPDGKIENIHKTPRKIFEL